ncbi:TPA: helix-turn-helix domain-containing protein [Photobacterium damselae]
MENIGSRLLYARKMKGFSQSDLADLIGVQQAIISKIERGKVSSTKNILELAAALDVTPTWLAMGTGQMQSDLTPLSHELKRLHITLENMELTEIEISSIVDEAIIKASKLKINIK